MDSYLFLEFSPNGGTWSIRPMVMGYHDELTHPMTLNPEPRLLAWLGEHGAVVWEPGLKGEAMLHRMKHQLGYWPNPIDLDVKPLSMVELNDDLSKVTGF